MRPKSLIGLVAFALFVVPASVQAQRGGGAVGGGGGAHFAGAPSGMAFRGAAPRESAGVRVIQSLSVANGSTVARPRSNPFSVYGAPVPYRLAGAVRSGSAQGIRAANNSVIAAGHVGRGNGSHHRHQPRGGSPQFYFLTGGGYYYPAPALFDDSEDDASDTTEQQQDVNGQQQDVSDQQAENQQPPNDDQNYAPQEMSAEAAAPQPQESAPLPDVGSFTLVMRDGTQVDALAFTRAQDKIIYITPDGGRRSVAVSDIDGDSTERVNEERGTPLQLPL